MPKLNPAEIDAEIEYKERKFRPKKQAPKFRKNLPTDKPKWKK